MDSILWMFQYIVRMEGGWWVVGDFMIFVSYIIVQLKKVNIIL